MNNRKALAGLCMAIAVLGLGWAHTRQRRAPPALTPQDYMEIQQLYTRYTRALDMGGAGDGSDYLATFTLDAEFEIVGPQGTQVLRGMDELRRSVKRSHERLRTEKWSRRHAYTNLLVTPTAEGATASVWAFIFNVSAMPAFVDHAGAYDDTLVKTDAGWKFKKRLFRNSQTAQPSLPN